jgi:hypothetical protein
MYKITLQITEKDTITASVETRNKARVITAAFPQFPAIVELTKTIDLTIKSKTKTVVTGKKK